MDKIFVKNYGDPTPGSGEILIRIRATSLNFHDFAVVSGMISTGEGRIPMSGGAGEVVAIGEGVSRFSAGDSVVSLFFRVGVVVNLTLAVLRVFPGIKSMDLQLNMSSCPKQHLPSRPKIIRTKNPQLYPAQL